MCATRTHLHALSQCAAITRFMWCIHLCPEDTNLYICNMNPWVCGSIVSMLKRPNIVPSVGIIIKIIIIIKKHEFLTSSEEFSAAKITQAFHVNRTYTAICHTKDPGWAETHNERILRTLGKCRHNTHAVSD